MTEVSVMGRRFVVVLEAEDEGGFHIYCPLLPGCHSEGETVEESLANVEEAIAVYLESLIEHGEPIPGEE